MLAVDFGRMRENSELKEADGEEDEIQDFMSLCCNSVVRGSSARVSAAPLRPHPLLY
jgi:hypothetical protein